MSRSDGGVNSAVPVYDCETHRSYGVAGRGLMLNFVPTYNYQMFYTSWNYGEVVGTQRAVSKISPGNLCSPKNSSLNKRDSLCANLVKNQRIIKIS